MQIWSMAGSRPPCCSQLKNGKHKQQINGRDMPDITPDTLNWSIIDHSFDPSSQNHRETIFTIGNGYLCTRGAFEEGYPGESHATLIHGVFDDIPIVFTELANAPNWISLDILIGGERFSLTQGTVLEFERRLNLQTGLLTRFVRWRSPAGHTLEFLFERFTSLSDLHLLCQRVSITPLNFSGEIEIHADLNGSEDTLNLLHWSWMDQGMENTCAWFLTETRSTHIQLGMAMRLSAFGAQDLRQIGWDIKNHLTLVTGWQAIQGETVTVEKAVTVFTSRDVQEPLQAARAGLQNLPEPYWELAYAAHIAAWQNEWEQCDIVVEGDEDTQIALRFNLFQLLIAAPRQDERVNIGAKTLSGFGYRGHAFWDTEIFMLPFFTYTRPNIARNLLSYRWHNLPGARKKAAGNGYQGAQYPWESAATGEEVTPTWVPHSTDPTRLIRIWTGDIEIHVSSDIAYALWQYWRLTGDDLFFYGRAVEIILETARFWASRAEWNPKAADYEFTDVIGPDEYHDHVDNNFYTNYSARWHLLKALELVDWLKVNHPETLEALPARLNLDAREIGRWKEVAEKIYLSYDPDTRLIEQFDGYFKRQDVDLAEYADRTISMQALLGIEETNQTQVLKQPDVLMLFYLLPDAFDEKTVRINYDFYTPRTDHTFGSSLGPAIQSIMACRLGRIEEAYEHFVRASHADLYDVRGNARDGIHGASAGGLWQAVVFGFTGLRVTSDGWSVHPQLPQGWKRVSFKFYHHGELQEVEVLNKP